MLNLLNLPSQTPYPSLAANRSSLGWWSTCRFSTDEGVLIFFCGQCFDVLNREPTRG